MKSKRPLKVVCPYCGVPADLVTGTDLYPHRPDLESLKFWRCTPCDAHVGCHKNSKKHAPLGRLANAELRLEKMRAHAAFDPLWKLGSMARKEAYKWLAEQLGVPFSKCHVGMFDVHQCREVVAAVSKRNGNESHASNN